MFRLVRWFCRWLQPGHVGFLVRLIGDGERVAAVVAEPARGRYASAGLGLFALANLLLIGLMVKTLWLLLRGKLLPAKTPVAG